MKENKDKQLPQNIANLLSNVLKYVENTESKNNSIGQERQAIINENK